MAAFLKLGNLGARLQERRERAKPERFLVKRGIHASHLLFHHGAVQPTLVVFVLRKPERANEQARIANLIAISQTTATDGDCTVQSNQGAFTFDTQRPPLFELRPEIARALGIEVAE